MPAIPLALLAAGTGAQMLAPLVSSLGKAARESRKALREDVEKMKAGKLGMSDAERAQAGRDINRQIEASAKGTEEELRRQSAAAGFGRSGDIMKAQGDLQAQKMEAAAKGMAGVDAASTQLAQQRRQEILARLQAQKAQNQANINQAAGALGTATQMTGQYGIAMKDMPEFMKSAYGYKKQETA